MSMMQGTALVLAGGGGKGAYQIGAWKAMKEFGVDKNIKAVSGTSVGGLNAALFIQGDYQTAEDTWLNISQDKILTPQNSKIFHGGALIPFALTLPTVSGARLLTFLTNGVFSRNGLIDIIQSCLRRSSIENNALQCFMACFNIEKFGMDYINVSGMNFREVQTVLLATSALPGIFEPVAFKGFTYYDGGLGDNVPVKPLYDMGFRTFIVIHLGRESYVDEKSFPGASFIQIIPSQDLGSFATGTLDFSPAGSRKRIQQGYEDTAAILEPMYRMGLIQKKQIMTMQYAKYQEEEFVRRNSEVLRQTFTLQKKVEEKKKRLRGFWGDCE